MSHIMEQGSPDGAASPDDININTLGISPSLQDKLNAFARSEDGEPAMDEDGEPAMDELSLLVRRVDVPEHAHRSLSTSKANTLELKRARERWKKCQQENRKRRRTAKNAAAEEARTKPGFIVLVQGNM